MEKQTKQTPEIIIKAASWQAAISALPAIGPVGQELATNGTRSAIISCSVTFSEKAKKAELHENYTDIFIVQEGEEELFIGGKITDEQETEPGEWRGENLEGARTYRIAAGDVVIIPKGVAHRHGEGTVKLLIIKIA